MSELHKNVPRSLIAGRQGDFYGSPRRALLPSLPGRTLNSRHHNKSHNMKCYLTQFRPLAQTREGRLAIARWNFPPFIDASCRREPDFESDFPPITPLCRAGHFAPRLAEGDLVAYTTAELSYPSRTPRVRRLVAVLRIAKTFRSEPNELGTRAHERAAQWYRERQLPLPSSCMVPENRPLVLSKTDRHKCSVGAWDDIYLNRANEHGHFHVCEKVFCCLQDPPKLTNGQLHDWFGTVPGTQNPPALSECDFAELIRWLAGQATDSCSRRRLLALPI